MDEIIGSRTQDREFSVMLLSLFAVLALVLAAIGLYGVLSYTVSQRMGEIGIRMALGARSGDVRWMVLLEGLKPALVGVAAGLIGAVFATRVMQSLLFGVGVHDPLTFICVPLALLVVSALASYVPALRATRIDPCLALRGE